MKIIVSTILTLHFLLVFSQNKPVTDLVSESKNFNGKTVHGSARSLALGGAESPLGASIQSSVVNPAGFGLYRRSDFNITLGFNAAETKLTFQNLATPTSFPTSVNKLSTTSFGVALRNDVEKGLVKSSAFGITYNKLIDYDYEYEYTGRVASGGRRTSFRDAVGNTQQIDYYQPDVIDANGTIQTNDIGALAYWGYVVRPKDETDPEETDYYIDNTQSPSIISEKVTSTGSKNSWDICYGANIDDKLFWGVGIGLGVISRRIEKLYSEVVENYPGDGLREFSMRQVSTNRGYGLNLKAGLIYRIDDNVRLSYAFHTATRYRMEEEYSANIQTIFDSLSTTTYLAIAQTTSINTDYSYKEPWKMNFGGAYFLNNKQGFAVLEMEYQAYSKSKISGGGFNWDEENKQIDERYKNILNTKIGFEYRKGLGRYRFGFSLFGDPDKDEQYKRFMIGGGLGVKWKFFYADFGLAYEKHKFESHPYELSNNSQPQINTTLNRMHYNLTLGLTFEKEKDN